MISAKSLSAINLLRRVFHLPFTHHLLRPRRHLHRQHHHLLCYPRQRYVLLHIVIPGNTSSQRAVSVPRPRGVFSFMCASVFQVWFRTRFPDKPNPRSQSCPTSRSQRRATIHNRVSYAMSDCCQPQQILPSICVPPSRRRMTGSLLFFAPRMAVAIKTNGTMFRFCSGPPLPGESLRPLQQVVPGSAVAYWSQYPDHFAVGFILVYCLLGERIDDLLVEAVEVNHDNSNATS